MSLDRLIPDMYQKSVYKIDYKKLKKRGIKCLLFDLDNTLVSYQDTVPTQDVKELFHMLSENFKVIILSNSGKTRLKPFKDILNVDVAYKSFKPLKRKYKKILQIYGYKPEEIACIGDQLITDIYGANRNDMVSILINPMGTKEPTPTKFNRFWEKKIYKRFAKKGILIKGEYYE